MKGGVKFNILQQSNSSQDLIENYHHIDGEFKGISVLILDNRVYYYLQKYTYIYIYIYV